MNIAQRVLLSLVTCIGMTVVIISGINVVGRVLDHSEGPGDDNYTLLRNSQDQWAGPKAGEIIELKHLVDEQGAFLTSTNKSNLLLLSVVDPECGASRQSQDQFEYLSLHLNKLGIDYSLVCFSQTVPKEAITAYGRSLGDFSIRRWSNGFDSILPSIKRMVIPSHILVDTKGSVIKSFPGSSKSHSVRLQMVHDILKEVIVERNARSESTLDNN